MIPHPKKITPSASKIITYMVHHEKYIWAFKHDNIYTMKKENILYARNDNIQAFKNENIYAIKNDNIRYTPK
jgi:hypothetical protein